MPRSCLHCGFSVASLFILCLCLRLTTSFYVNIAGSQQRQRPHLLRCPHLSRYHILGTCREATKDEISNTKEQLGSSTDETFPKPKSARNIKTNNGVRGVNRTANALETGSKRKRKKRKTPQGPLYWRNETDLFIFQDQDLMNATCMKDVHLIRFQVRGNPRPLRRHRTAKGFMYNPSATYQQSFRKIVEDMVRDENPVFAEEHQLAMRIIFHMKRPMNHFVGSKPGPGRLKPAAPPRLAPSRTDVDNLAKFVLDSLNGLLYVDDRQVTSIFATKIFDNDGRCEGSTEVSIQKLTEDHVDDLLHRGLAPYRTMHQN